MTAILYNRFAMPLACFIAVACSTKTTAKSKQNTVVASQAESETVSQPVSATQKPLASETDARHLLNQLFRAQGLRIVNDFEFWEDAVEVTLDGYDPQRKIGFEYIAPPEIGRDLSEKEMQSLQSSDIFVSLPTSLADLKIRCDVFFQEHLANQSKPIETAK